MKKTVMMISFCVLSVFLYGCGQQFFEDLLTQALSGENSHTDSILEPGEIQGTEEALKSDGIKEENETSGREETETDYSSGYIYDNGFYYPIINRADTSSDADNAHDSSCLIDFDETTFWATEEGDTVSASVRIEFEKEFTISDMILVNGSVSDTDEEEEYCRIRAFTLTFDDGEENIYEIRSDEKYWSTEMIPRTTKSVLITVEDVFDSDLYNQLAVTEIVFCYSPDSYFAAQGMGDKPVMTENSSSGIENSFSEKMGAENEKEEEEKQAAAAYTPEGWVWTPTGYDAQDIDEKYLRSGKWVSEDGTVVLYIDYYSSPDIMDYGLYMGGMVYEGAAWTEVIQENGLWTAISAEDEENNIYFTVPKAGQIQVKAGEKTIILELKRQKYDIYDDF